MGRNRTPTPILDAKGAYIANPQRARENEPQGQRPLGPPPKYLSADEKKVWKELARQMLPGVVFESDRTLFELWVRLKTKMIHHFATMKAAEQSLLTTLASKFAASPADRSKVSAEAPKESGLSSFLKNRPNSRPVDSVH